VDFARAVFAPMAVPGAATSPATRASRAVVPARPKAGSSAGPVAKLARDPVRGPSDPDPSDPGREGRARLHLGPLVPGPSIRRAMAGATRALGPTALAPMSRAVLVRAGRAPVVGSRHVNASNLERGRGLAVRQRLAGRRRGLLTSHRGAGLARTPSPTRVQPTSGAPDPRSRAASSGASSRVGAAIQADRFAGQAPPSDPPTVAPISASGRRSTSP
jgi:hypothetical protein